MGTRGVLLLALLVCLYSGVFGKDKPEELRLISFNESYAQWMPVSKVDELAGRVKFVDITDHRDIMTADCTLRAQADPLPAQPLNKRYVREMTSEMTSKTFMANLQNLTSFFTRYYTSSTGAEAARWIAAQYENYGKGYDGIKVELFSHNFSQPSVIATIPGMGPHKNQIVVLGAHEDSIVSGNNTARSPGADDDGSGTVTVLEVFRLLTAAGHLPDRTIKFMAYAGEERGLLGSRDIAAAYKKNNSDVYAVLQLDMTGYGGMNTGIVGDCTDPGLNNFLKSLIDTYTDLIWEDTVCGYGCSDHASWTNAGYRASMPFETPFDESNPDIHKPIDVIENLNPVKMLEFAKLGLGFAVELAGRTVM